MADKLQQDRKAQRLAEQLRTNLRRRKSQGREMKASDGAAAPATVDHPSD